MKNNWHNALGFSLIDHMGNSNEPWGYKDNNSYFVYANNAYKNLLNISPSFDIEGKKDGELPAPTSDFEAEFQVHDRMVEREEKKISSLEVNYFGAEQTIQAYKFTKYPCYDKNHKILGTIFHGEKLLKSYIKASLAINTLVSNNKIPEGSFLIHNNGYQSLNSKEHKLLFLLGIGFSIKEIAEKLNLNKRTVENYFTLLRDHFNVSKTSDLKDIAWSKGFVKNIPEIFLIPQSRIIK